MTQSLQIESRVGTDGVLTLRVPLGPSDANTDVIVTIRPKSEEARQIARAMWPPRIFREDPWLARGRSDDDPGRSRTPSGDIGVTYLLDTNACVMYMNGRAPRLRQRLDQCRPGEIVVCSIVKAELFYAALKSNNPASWASCGIAVRGLGSGFMSCGTAPASAGYSDGRCGLRIPFSFGGRGQIR